MKSRKFVNSDIGPKNNDLHLTNGYINSENTIKSKLTNGHQVSTVIHVKNEEISIHEKSIKKQLPKKVIFSHVELYNGLQKMSLIMIKLSLANDNILIE